MNARPPRRIGRRLLLGAGVLGAAGLVTGTWVYRASYKSNVGQLDFTNPLPIPPVLDPDGADNPFRLDLQEGVTRFLPNLDTPTWGANGSQLGPTLRVRSGHQVRMAVRNRLREATTIHWHGMRLPAAMDGGPHQIIAPGEVWEPHWQVEQPAATLWYHPHLHPRTAEHVYRGIVGLLLIDDDNEAARSLPSRYGIDDIPLILQDKQFLSDGQLSLTTAGPLGIQTNYGLLGDTIAVNGTVNPRLTVSTQRVRFRLLNAANSRSFNVGFTDNRAFQLIGTDHGLLTEPLTMNRIRLASGERAEIVAAFTPGERAILRSFAPLLGGGFPQDRIAGATDEFDLLAVDAAPTLQPSAAVPTRLATLEPYRPSADATVRTFQLAGTSTINGQTMDLSRIDAVVPAGATEIWVLDNPGIPHSFHIHEAGFDILDINGAPPPPYLTGRKDTVYLPPSTTIRIAVRFGTHTSPTQPYMFHCHMLEHHDLGMMGQFVIVAPGTEDQVDRQISLPDTPTDEPHNHG